MSDTPGDAQEARVAAGSGGLASALWGRQDGDFNWRVETRPWAASAWRPFTTLSADDVDAVSHEIAMEEVGGEAIAVWRISDGDFFRIHASSGS